MPELFEVLSAGDTGLEGLPPPTMPYYVAAKEGLFLHRATQIGNVILPADKWPTTLHPIGFPKGLFTWTGDNLPTTIISQAHDFFRRIYAAHGTEAEVLITQHNQTRAFRLFIPYQRVNGSAVHSVFEPSHVLPSYTIVGTIHSHCNFSAFHSGTDSHDASEMDGVHLTMGFVTRDTPDVVAMVTMNGKEFHYSDPAVIADLTFGADTAPPWWDRYVFPASVDVPKPKGLKSITDAQWDSFRGIVTAKATKHNTAPPTTPAWTKATKNNATPITISAWTPAGPYSGWSQYNDWDDYSLYSRPITTTPVPVPTETTNDDDTETPLERALNLAWEAGIIDDSDWVELEMDGHLENPTVWTDLFRKKMASLADALHQLGYSVSYSIGLPKITPPHPRQLPGQTTIDKFTEELVQ